MLPDKLREPLGSTMKASVSLWQEFKEFAFKGRFIDLAIGVVIGAATTAVINSMVNNLVMPLVGLIRPGEHGHLEWTIGPMKLGAFIGDLVNFMLTAGVVFLVMVKFLGAMRKASEGTANEEPLVKECPLCLSTIPYKARKCAHCTADLQAA